MACHSAKGSTQRTDSRVSTFFVGQPVRVPTAEAATAPYVALAREHGLDPAQMALAYVLGRRFLTSAIIGATNLTQLQNSIAAKDLVLSEEVLNSIESLHKIYTYPCP